MRWKSAQYRATGSEDRFAIGWNVELMERIHAAQDQAFGGMLSALYAGDELAAVSMSMRSHAVFHYWFPTYSAEFATYSPGLILLMAITRAAPALGLRTIDLGKGWAPYKERFATGVIKVAEGDVHVPSTITAVRAARSGVANRIRRSPLRGAARRARRMVRR
jgi:CelD/BcsL family acetyltransferase involved in cellulose biosynthesis